MDFLKIETKDLIKLLLEDYKVNVVREAIMKDDYDSMIKAERLNYCTEEELSSICADINTVMYVLSEYKINIQIIEIFLDNFMENSKVVEAILDKYIDVLMPKHFELLIKNLKYKSWISSNISKVNDESTIYLHGKSMIPRANPRQTTLIVEHGMKDASVYNLKLDEIYVLSYIKIFDEEELRYILDKIFDLKVDLLMKGYIEDLMRTQTIPKDILYKVVTQWTYDCDETWFKKMLSSQNLDGVIDYILDNVPLTKDSIWCILKNKNTSTKKLGRIYDKYMELVVECNPVKLPILECNVHMC